jgi:hypothetical protein
MVIPPMGSVNTMQDVIERDGARGGSQGDGKSSIEQRAIERCFDCRHDTATARSCTTATIAFPDGTTRKAVRYGERADAPVADRCPRCRVRAGGYHHPFCPVETCPRCEGRLAACRCLDADKTR